jgi:uncharacterized UBP type Zn finger protein
MGMIKTPPRIRLPETLLKLIHTRQLKEKPCSHLDLIQFWKPAVNVCQECVDAGDSWPNLRMCLVCGYVGCCDTSKKKHMKLHIDSPRHPIIRSVETGEGWVWCYVDGAFLSAKSPRLSLIHPRFDQ